MSLPAVDVVVLSLDRRDDTEECIDSIQAQTHPQVHLFVIDQGSEAATVAALQQRASKEGFHFSQVGRTGVPAGRNSGSALGQAPLIVSLDNDAVFSDPEVLSRTAQRFQSQPTLGALAFAVHDYRKGGADEGSWGYPWPAETHFDKEFPAARYCGAGHALRRQAWEEAGGYDESLFFFAEELDLSWSMIRLGYEIYYDPSVAVRHKSTLEHRIHWQNGRFYYNARNMTYLLRKHLADQRRVMSYCLGYVYRGLRNGMTMTALRGIRDGFKMEPVDGALPPLSEEAREYIERYEFAPRGSLWQRFKQEVKDWRSELPSR